MLVSPFVLSLASKQDKKHKVALRGIFLSILMVQILLGFLNWENFTSGRSGFELSLTYPNSFLGFFFLVSILQFTLLLVNKSLYTLAVVFNFINTILVFIDMIKLSNILGFQAVSFASIGAVFLVLFGNIIGLSFINKDKNLFNKYPYFK